MPIEWMKPTRPQRNFRAAMFDFDGTLSLIREGWSGIMADIGTEMLAAQNLLTDSVEAERNRLEEGVLRLSGRPSIDQMRYLESEGIARGATGLDAIAMLEEFQRRLFARIADRTSDLKAGRVPSHEWAVPGTHALLDSLRAKGVALYLASGTVIDYVRAEAALLGVDHYFGERIYAPSGETATFRKRDVVARILSEQQIAGEELIGFGDGFSETLEVKAVGGTVIGIASREKGEAGPHPMKRKMLIELGADAIVADYADHASWLGELWA